MSEFRFEGLNIWKLSIEIADNLFDIADMAEGRKYYRFAEQLRAATMSISNNIAEGSGSFSDKDFANYLVISRKSVFECANILILFLKRKIITNEIKEKEYNDLQYLSKMITNFRKSLINNNK